MVLFKINHNRLILAIFIFLISFYLLLLIPDSSEHELKLSNKIPFIWDQDHYWKKLEEMYNDAQKISRKDVLPVIDYSFMSLNQMVMKLEKNSFSVNDSLFFRLEKKLFETATLLAAHPVKVPEFIQIYSSIRTQVKNQSLKWDFTSILTRNRIYRLLYGGRKAIEEVLLQHKDKHFPTVFLSYDEPSATPSAMMLGVKIHSGDILVSRGGAPTSALIARGSDYPGNFSHIALVHVDEKTSIVSMIEAHIEIGVAVASLEEYLGDKKLRVMILRPRSDLPIIKTNPMIPHKAASLALKRAVSEHIPYDFNMIFNDHSKLFCSEVAFAAYNQLGLSLWTATSNISSPGVASWLAAFGVTNFQTQEPSDLEYDPQVQVVAEWRNIETLFDDHIDNAILDVMLEGAENGERIKFAWYKLPIGRIVKFYSIILNLFDKAGPIPEGMSATAALKNEWFSSKHRQIKRNVLFEIKKFKQNKGYSPPYWELIKISREVKYDAY